MLLHLLGSAYQQIGSWFFSLFLQALSTRDQMMILSVEEEEKWSIVKDSQNEILNHLIFFHFIFVFLIFCPCFGTLQIILAMGMLIDLNVKLVLKKMVLPDSPFKVFLYQEVMVFLGCLMRNVCMNPFGKTSSRVPFSKKVLVLCT